MVARVVRMSETNNDHGHEDSRSPREQWREILSAIDDRILRACLPKTAEEVTVDSEHVFISVESEFKKQYCLRKVDEISNAVAATIGEHLVTIGEPPLIEQAREETGTTQSRAHARIAVLGIGDGGVNAIDRMHQERLQGVRLIAVDTDRQVLNLSRAHQVLQIGMDVTGGRGTGGDEERGRKSAHESRWDLAALLKGLDLVFITAGLGGGTGTGAAPVIAELAREAGALTIAVVTRPFTFEGTIRRGRADRGIESLRSAADVLVAISNDRLIETAAKGLAITQAFELADGILYQGVQGISDLVTVRGLVNLDFADLRVVLSGAGQAMMGMGQGSGEQRAVTAAKTACSNPLLEAGSIRGARKIILNVTGGNDLTLGEVTEAADTVRRFAATECDLVFGAVVRDDLAGEEEVRLTVIAADFGEPIEESERGDRSVGHPRKRVSADEDLDVPTYLRRSQQAKQPPSSSDERSA